MGKLILACTCGHRMRVPDDALGKAAKCTKCGKTLSITEKNTKSVAGNGAPGKGDVASAKAHSIRKRIGELLVDAGLINDEQLKAALELQKSEGGKIAQVLMSMDYFGLPDFIGFLAKQPGIASIDLGNYQIPQDHLALISRELALKHEVFPIDKMGKLLTLGMACPLDTRAIADIEEVTGLKVKALLCPAKDIRRAIDRYYPSPETPEVAEVAPTQEEESLKAESALKLWQVSAVVGKLDGLPALPDTVERVREAMDDVSTSLVDIAEIIGYDPSLAARVLSVANSAAYGFPNRVEDLALAVTLLGLREAYSIVLSASVIDLFDKSKSFDYRGFWNDAMNCAKATRIIAAKMDKQKQGGYFSAGLLHDIGRIALAETVAKDYSKVPGDLVGEDLLAKEEAIIGFTHTEAGYVLAENWNLPKELSEPIRYHHAPENATEAVEHVAAVAVADILTRCDAGNDQEKKFALEECAPLFSTLKIDAETAAGLFDEIATIERERDLWKSK